MWSFCGPGSTTPGRTAASPGRCNSCPRCIESRQCDAVSARSALVIATVTGSCSRPAAGWHASFPLRKRAPLRGSPSRASRSRRSRAVVPAVHAHARRAHARRLASRRGSPGAAAGADSSHPGAGDHDTLDRSAADRRRGSRPAAGAGAGGHEGPRTHSRHRGAGPGDRPGPARAPARSTWCCWTPSCATCRRSQRSARWASARPIRRSWPTRRSSRSRPVRRRGSVAHGTSSSGGRSTRCGRRSATCSR